MYLFLNDSSLYPENIQLLKNLTNHPPYWLGGFFNKKLDKAGGKINYGVGVYASEALDKSEGRFPLGNYWHQKEYKYMWLDELM